MPTENRSSNTEMVSVPEGFMLVESERAALCLEELQECESQRDELYAEITGLRAQLAEAHALLRELEGDHTLMLQFGASEFGETECKTLRARLAKLRTYLRTSVSPATVTPSAPSASAEPSAPVEIDHDALVAAVCMLRSQGLGNLSEAVEAARAALERKS